MDGLIVAGMCACALGVVLAIGYLMARRTPYPPDNPEE